MDRRGIIVCAVSTPEQVKLTSLDQQEKDGRAFFEQEHIELIEVLRLDGYSRNFYTLREFVAYATKKGSKDAAKFERYLLEGGFDVMWVRATNRVAREQSINAEVINRAVKECKAQIYSQVDGWITKSNRRGVVAITGFRDSSEGDETRIKRQTGIKGRLAKNAPVSARVPISHTIIRVGKEPTAVEVRVNEAFQPAIHAAIKLLTEGVPYYSLERELYTRFGIGDERGQPYSDLRFRTMFYNAHFWGNNVIRWKEHSPYANINGLWAFDPGEPLPSGVEVVYGAWEPAVTGDEANALKTIMRQRHDSKNNIGKAYPNPFALLIVCDICRGHYSYNRKPRKNHVDHYYFCAHSIAVRYHETACRNTRLLRMDDIIEYVNGEIDRWLQDGAVPFTASRPGEQSERDYDRLQRESRQLERSLETLADELLRADDDLKDLFRKRLRAAKNELAAAQRQLAELQVSERRQIEVSLRQQASLAQIREIGLPRFWTQPPAIVNAQLRDLFGDYRLTAADGELKAWALSPYRPRPRRRERKPV